MTRDEYIKEVASFATAYVSRTEEQTAERKQLIADAALAIFGERRGCDSCLIEFAVRIYNLSKMEATKYHVNHGVVLELFSRADLTMTVHNTTDDLAELHLAEWPNKLIYFDEYPKDESGNWVGISDERHHELKEKFGLVESAELTEEEVKNLKPKEIEEVETEAPTETHKRGRKPAHKDLI